MARTLIDKRTFASSSSNATYTAYAYSDGSYGCNCPGFTQRAARECKHTRQMAAEAGAAPVSSPVPPTKTPTVETVAPMLASAMTTRVTGVAFDRTYAGWWLEEKLDGHRCMARVTKDLTVHAWSRPRAGGNGANARSLPANIVAQLQTLGPGLYDGELVAPSGKAWDVTTVGAPLVFVVFDALEIGKLNLAALDYVTRRRALLDRLATLPPGQQAISTVESVPATWAAVEAIWQRGGEGAILKRPHSTYQRGARSADWIKVKELNHDCLTVIGFEAGLNGPCSKFRLQNAAGLTTTVKVLGNAMLAQVSANPAAFVGRHVVISYQHKTPSGTYRHGIFDHFAGPGEVPPVNPSPEDDPMKNKTAKTAKTTTAKTTTAKTTTAKTATKPAAKIAAKPASKAAAPAKPAPAAKPAKATKPAPVAAPTGRAAVDWVAAGRKAYETKMRNLAAKAAAQPATAAAAK